MLWLTLILACETGDGDFKTIFKPTEKAPAAAAAAEAAPEAPRDDRFPTDEELAALDDPWGQAAGNVGGFDDLIDEPDDSADSVEPVEPVEPDPPEATPAEPPPAPVAAPPPVGLASQPAWGVRLLNTIPQAQPPRAALGLPSGEEIVVSPGSMLPEVGVIVIAVGPNVVQLAKVTPEGDHAEIETSTLVAQYQTAPIATQIP